MRAAFIRSLSDIARKESRLHLLTGDLGFGVFEDFIERYPNKFTNAGVAEANMVGIAAGMARRRFRCVCYSIAPFLVFRALEQIRNDICYHNMDVKIVGVGGGYGYSLNGQSHCAIEDISVMCSLPNMTVLCPGDPVETYYAVKNMFEVEGPVYLRLGKQGEKNIFDEKSGVFKMGGVVKMKEGSNLVLFSVGNILERAVSVIERFALGGMNFSHMHVHKMKPLDKERIRDVIAKHDRVVTIEEHSVIGGLGSAISEINSSYGDCLKKMLFIGVEDKYINTGGNSSYVRKVAGIDEETIYKRISEWI